MMKNTASRLTIAALCVALGACASVPTGPSRLVLPGTGKAFDEFRGDDYSCRQFATDQIGGTSAQNAAVDSTARSAALGTVVGAVAGAAIGGSRGAGVGAGTGLLFGTAAGSGAAAGSSYDAQQRYDNSYLQCMYAKGHRVPVAGRFIGPPAAQSVPSQPPPVASPPAGVPPPPPGTPPPPPPGSRG